MAALERILLHAYTSGHPNALPNIIGCIWAPVDKAAESQLISPGGCGVISCLDHLTAAGTYLDPFQSLRLQYQIMQLMTRLIHIADKNLLHALCSCGIVRSLVRFLQSAFDVIRDIPRLGLLTLFARENKALVASIRSVWNALILIHDDKIYEDIVDLGLLTRLSEDWLSSNVALSLSVADADFNPLLIRAEALSMIQIIILNRPHSERVLSELVRGLGSTNTVKRELATLRSTSTTKGSTNMRRTAAEVLATLAMISAESIDEELLVSFLKIYVIFCDLKI